MCFHKYMPKLEGCVKIRIQKNIELTIYIIEVNCVSFQKY